MTIRALIVDDEPLACRRLRRLLRTERDLEVVGECGDGASALAAIRRGRPDLVFLDVRLPGVDGLTLLRRVAGGPRPEVVFVTAYDRYAASAFDHEAVDYVLKPIAPERLREAVERARRRLGGRESGAAVPPPPSSLPTPLERLLVRERGRAFFVRADEVEWIEAAGNYARLHHGRRAHALRTALTALERRLDPQRFRRVSRSALVNVDRVAEIQPWFHGDALVILQSGARVRLSRRYRSRLLG